MECAFLFLAHVTLCEFHHILQTQLRNLALQPGFRRASEADFLEFRKSFKGLVVGTHLKGSVDYRSVDYAGKPVILLMGNEQAGLPETLAHSCDKLIRIPQDGRADSLNLAVATAVSLYEIRRHALKVTG